MLKFRNIFLTGFIFCFSVLLAAYYIEYQLLIEPCPLCLLQRIVFALIGLVFFIGYLANPVNIGRYLSSAMISLFAMMGIALAARQIWLQHLPPDQVPSCSAGVERLLELYPILDVLSLILKGTAECAEIDFEILTLPLSNWSLLGFSGFFFISIALIVLQKKRRI